MADGFSKQSVPPSDRRVSLSVSDVPLSVRDMFRPARLSLLNALQTRADAVAAAVNKTSAEYRFRVIVSVALAGSGFMLTGASLHKASRAESAVTALQQTVLQRDLDIVRLSIQSISTSISEVRDSTYPSFDTIFTARERLLRLRNDLGVRETRLDILGRQIRGNDVLRQEFLLLSGLVNRLKIEIIALQGALDGAGRDLLTAQASRSQEIQRNALFLAAEAQRSLRLPCDDEALRMACKEQLQGITCYAFTPADRSRAPCGVVMPLCHACGLHRTQPVNPPRPVRATANL